MEKKNFLESLTTRQKAELLALERERTTRSCEALRIYRPLPYQKPFHEHPGKELLVIGGNRSGKTLCHMVELAWALTGQHPVKGRYPEKDGKAVLVCSSWRHVGTVIAPLLLKAGAFWMIRDKETKEWRAYEPLMDRDRIAERKPAPPLIPPRLVESVTWLLKAGYQAQQIVMKNGWTLNLYSSDGEPPQGFSADIVSIDEDITNDQSWVPEMQARLADRRGRLIWSAMPHSRNDSLLGLVERAEKGAAEGKNHIHHFQFSFTENPTIDAEEKKRMLERWSAQGPEVLKQRAEGAFTFESLRVYPSFSQSIHGVGLASLPNGAIPNDWTRWASIDPGHAVMGAVFAAMPPDGKHLYIYDELVIPEANAFIFAEKFAEKVAGNIFHAFLIDSHGARLTDFGTGKSPAQQYTEALAALNVSSEATGSSFIPGCDDLMAGVESVRRALHIRPCGTSFLRVVTETCPNLFYEAKRYRRQVTTVGGNRIIQDKPATRSQSHLLDCLRYLCAFEPKYHAPKKSAQKPWWWDQVQRRRKGNGEDNAVYLAPQSYSANYSEVYYA